MPSVRVIPAKKQIQSDIPAPLRDKRKVAGYARVSTDHEEQHTSYEAQVDYYTNYINAHEDWVFAGIYTDDGISATSTTRRHGFNQMVSDALDGKIDLIITKSVSRFARNTVDSLTTVRKLKNEGIEIYFEKENIWTLDAKGELLITIMSSIAQEESRNISENVKWGHRKRFADGKVSVSYGQFLGYEKGEDGKMVVNREQAQVVQMIYAWFLEGLSYHGIASKLTEMHIPTPGGKTQWRQAVVKSILQNEKYKGDALLQKTYIVDFLTKKSKKNEGEIPQYYVENDHEAIITPEQFQEVQDEIARRDAKKGKYSGVSPFASKIICGECGGFYGAKVWHSTDKYKKTIYRCNNKYDGKRCDTPTITEDEIKESFIKAVNILLKDKGELVQNAREMLAIIDTTESLERQRSEVLDEMEVVAGLMEKAISENAKKAQDQKAYEKRYQKLVDRYEKANGKNEDLAIKIDEVKRKIRGMESFIKTLEETDEVISYFDLKLWQSLLDYVQVHSKEDMRFIFKNGEEIKL